jgi:predicted  nucleic acid-binding Zn-ribbon protein
MAIPPQQFNEIRKGERLHLCPTCQRILYYREEEQEA